MNLENYLGKLAVSLLSLLSFLFSVISINKKYYIHHYYYYYFHSASI